MSALDSASLLQNIQQYVQQLKEIQEQLTISPIDLQQPHIQLLHAKIASKVKHFQTAAQQLRCSTHSRAGIRQIERHLAEGFSQVVKEAHRLLQMKVRKGGKEKLRKKLELLGRLEGELDQDWEKANRDSRDSTNGMQSRLLRRIDENTSILADHVDQTQLRSIAKSYLHREFLAIRMVAYQMYQRYTDHKHPQLIQQMEEVQEQQYELNRVLEELSGTNRELRGEERRLVRELNELKKVNEMVAKRYFIPNNSKEL